MIQPETSETVVADVVLQTEGMYVILRVGSAAGNLILLSPQTSGHRSQDLRPYALFWADILTNIFTV